MVAEYSQTEKNMAGFSWLGKHRHRTGLCALAVSVMAMLFIWPAGQVAVTAAPVSAQNSFAQIKPLLLTNCFKCHSDKKQKGGVNFSLITDEKSILRNRKLWHKVV